MSSDDRSVSPENRYRTPRYSGCPSASRSDDPNSSSTIRTSAVPPRKLSTSSRSRSRFVTPDRSRSGSRREKPPLAPHASSRRRSRGRSGSLGRKKTPSPRKSRSRERDSPPTSLAERRRQLASLEDPVRHSPALEDPPTLEGGYICTDGKLLGIILQVFMLSKYQLALEELGGKDAQFLEELEEDMKDDLKLDIADQQSWLDFIKYCGFRRKLSCLINMHEKDILSKKEFDEAQRLLDQEILAAELSFDLRAWVTAHKFHPKLIEAFPDVQSLATADVGHLRALGLSILMAKRALTEVKLEFAGRRIKHLTKLWCLGLISDRTLEQRKQLIVGGVLGPKKDTDEVPRGSLQIHPPAENLVVHADRDRERFNLPTQRGEVDLSELPDGSYSVVVSSQVGVDQRSLLPLLTFQLEKQGGKVEPNFVATEASLVRASAFSSDKPLKAATMEGSFEKARGGGRWTVQTKAATSDLLPSLALPAGDLSVTLSGTDTVKDKPVNLAQKVVVPQPAKKPANKKEMREIGPLEARVTQDSWHTLLHDKGARSALFLGDVSGSMADRDGRLQKLKAAFVQVLNTRLEKGTPIAIAAWNDGIESWCCNHKGFLKKEKKQEALEWVSGLGPRGGTQMDHAICAGIAVVPDVQDVIVVCDGDVSAFTEDSWAARRKQFMNQTFHFVAVGVGSDYASMQKMAVVGGGSFTHEQ